MLEDKIITCADTIYAYSEGDSQCWSYTADNDKWFRFKNLDPHFESNKTNNFFKLIVCSLIRKDKTIVITGTSMLSYGSDTSYLIN